jgi:hypothetical protein
MVPADRLPGTAPGAAPVVALSAQGERRAPAERGADGG